ncbi:MAG: DUF1501 domain-containing protein [Fuerstiella sp.]|nr:DUF1501 domain-containing protein [Fuerstiella sp.]
MLNLLPQRMMDCEKTDRRRFLLEVGSLSGLGLTLPQLLRGHAVSAADTPDRTDVNCILVWTRGGTSHHDTLDPKPDARAEIRGEFNAIDTALPGVHFTDMVPHFAKHADKYAVVRNLNSINGAHGTADAIMMSGWQMNPTVTYPCYGSVIAKHRADRNNMPPFVQLGNEVDRKFLGGTAGYLGIGHNPFEIHSNPAEAEFSVRDLTPPGGMNLARVNLRRDALRAIDRFQRDLEKRPGVLQAFDKYYENAFNMVTSPATQRAFDLEQESVSTRDAYGRTRFGQSCLLARRLIQAGTRFVTVSDGDWDTHRDNFSRLRKLLPPVDQGFTALLVDLKQRGLLENTLVVWLTDFGRTPTINPAAGRDHWASAGIAVFAGADTPVGTIVGQTDATGAQCVDREYYPRDIAATIYHKLGIPLNTTHVIGNGRPMRLCEGTPIEELML